MRTPHLAAGLLTTLLFAACHAEPHGAKGHHDEAPERPALSFTHWTDESELFLELPALVVGQDSPCAAHVTRLAGFEALAAGRVTAVLRGGPAEERFEQPAPSVPGIFRPVVKPATAGVRRLVVEVRAEGLSADHDLGEVTVYESEAAAIAGIPEEPEAAGRIPFLKEQQWPIPFATAVVDERTIRSSLRTTGTLRARPDGDVTVTAPVAGRVASAGRPFPKPGERVSIQALVGVIVPRLEAADLASLELAVTSAELELRFAERERLRLEALRTDGAVPERRVQDAVDGAAAASAALQAAQRRLEQFRRVDRGPGRDEGSVQLRAPLSGVVTQLHVAPGSFVEAGAPLFRVTDVTQLLLEAQVHEVDVAGLGTPSGASFEIEGLPTPFELPASALVTRGHVLDPRSRTLPVSFAVDNASGRFAVGQFAHVALQLGDERRALAVPESAIVDDGGLLVVFAQVEGEAFARRIVRLGARDRGFVEVTSGLRAGEHVVTTGAWSVKLAASGGAVPAHGHAH